MYVFMCFHIGNLSTLFPQFGFSSPWFSFSHQPISSGLKSGDYPDTDTPTCPQITSLHSIWNRQAFGFQRPLLIGFGIGFFAPPLSSQPTRQATQNTQHTHETHPIFDTLNRIIFAAFENTKD